ncbi:MAG: succinylglutamate desuccinylase/aspartoacylase family protein [Myxococcota bacterium]
MNPQLEHWLSRFEALCRPGPDGYRWSHREPGTRAGREVVFSAMIHGDEYGTLPATVRLIEALKAGTIAYTGPVTVLLGNPEAARAERRFLDFDLNRAWVFEIDRPGHEPRRARELRPILDRAHLLLDMHQTILESETSFWIFPWDPVFGLWARVLGSAPVGLTRTPGQAFAAGGLRCVDEYVRESGRTGFCVEFGRKGFDDTQADNAFRSMKRMLETFERIELEHTTLEAEADRGEPIRWYTTIRQEDWGDPARRLRAGLKNWSAVQAGVDLADAGSPPIVPIADGVVLFPKYPDAGEPLPSHLFHLAIPLSRHPSEEFGGSPIELEKKID